ncbi:MAG: hypothetical protein A4S12_08890 [Proteobacteria bacterium SG_bin5]|nr:UrcA family protein [Sphingomonas sp.]OQW41207.1 MAG: hypothetical protein A4S12_08890 [Proteobacteria bacterium SG_bin5]
MRFVTLIALPLALSATTAFAQTTTNREPVTAAVSLEHLDLTSARGQQAAQARVERAAHQLCDLNARPSLFDVAESNRCYADALASGQAAAARAIAAAQGRAPMVASTNAAAAGTR